MQLRRAVEIMNNKQQMGHVCVYYNDKQVDIKSVDSNIGTAYVEFVDDSHKCDVEIEKLHEKIMH